MQQYKNRQGHFDKFRQSHVDFELTNVIMGIERRMNSISADKTSMVYQLINLVGYKYLSENIKNNSGDFGYELNEDLYYENLLIDKGDAINILKKGISQITRENENKQAADVFYNLFDLFDFETFCDNETWLLFIEWVEELTMTMATLGETIIYLTKYISSSILLKSAFPIPTEDIVRFMATNHENVKNIYDPFATDATLIAEIGNLIDVENYYGQHPNMTSCILGKMTLLANNVNYKNIFIKCNDITDFVNLDVKFDLCVSIPPFGYKTKLNCSKDPRFDPYVPRGAFVYIFDMLHHLDENGSIKVVVPNSVLSNPTNQKINKHLVDDHLISSIIGLPRGLFDFTSIPTTLLTINKKSNDDGIYYLNTIDAKTRRSVKRRALSIVAIDKYIDLLINNEEKELMSKIVSAEEIEENDYILSMNRYVDSEKLEIIDIEKTISNIREIKRELNKVEGEVNNKINDLFF